MSFPHVALDVSDPVDVNAEKVLEVLLEKAGIRPFQDPNPFGLLEFIRVLQELSESIVNEADAFHKFWIHPT